MELQIFKNYDDYENVVKNGAIVDYYVTTLNGYDYVMNGQSSFRYINWLNEKHGIYGLYINKVLRTRNSVTVILNLDSCATNFDWNEILNDIN